MPELAVTDISRSWNRSIAERVVAVSGMIARGAHLASVVRACWAAAHRDGSRGVV
jgi:hypothetical protein